MIDLSELGHVTGVKRDLLLQLGRAFVLQVSVSKWGLQISRHSASVGRGREPTIRSLFTIFPLSYFKNCAAFKSLLIERWLGIKVLKFSLLPSVLKGIQESHYFLGI